MIIKKSILVGIAICGLLLRSDATEKKIALTIDDLPCTNCTDFQMVLRTNEEIIRILSENKIPAVGFVNESKLYSEGKPDPAKMSILRQWLEKGFELGNHTFSHIRINTASLAEYENDLLQGEIIIRPLMAEFGKNLRYFRHPQLRTGPTPEYKAKLDALLLLHGYQTAPVTIDNDEYIYALCYRKAKERNDSEEMRSIAADYLNYMRKVISHYENLSLEFLGYQVNQVMLIHVNELNADYLELLVKMLKEMNYSLIPLEEALKDKAYALPESFHEKGISWIDRWRIAKGLEMKPQPAVSDWILKMADQVKES